MRVTGLDHVVLRVTDARRSLAWYERHLGLAPVRVAEWEAGDAPFPSLRIDVGTILDLVEVDGPADLAGPGGVDHLCCTVDATADELGRWAASGVVEAEGPPRTLFGARGDGVGVYVRDPDGHRIELRTYER